VSLDVRDACDQVREAAVEKLIAAAYRIAARRGLAVTVARRSTQSTVRMDPALCNVLASSGLQRMSSGAGHDAMIVAPHVPATMLFVRSPGGVSHSPKEAVNDADVEAALSVGLQFFNDLEKQLV
jgi:allantoate deiminase